MNREQPHTIDPAVMFARAMKKWIAAGFNIVSKEIFNTRASICSCCEFFDHTGAMGTGKCMKCGCGGAKKWIATEKCPIDKWGTAL